MIRSKRKTLKEFKHMATENAEIAFETLNEISELKKDKEALLSHVANLEHQAIGYQAVISYLEHRLGV